MYQVIRIILGVTVFCPSRFIFTNTCTFIFTESKIHWLKKEYDSAMYMLSLVLIRFPYHCLCLCNLLHTYTVAHSEFQLYGTCPCMQLSIHSGVAVCIHGWHLVDWSNMASMPWFWHSIASPIHLHLECGDLCRETASR